MEWKQEEIDFMIKNYHKIGPTKIKATLSNFTIDMIKNKAKKLNLKFNKKYIYPDLNIFENINSIYSSYIMGLLWSDGYIVGNNIGIENLKEDIDDIKHIFERLGGFYYSERLRKNRTKISACIQYCSKNIVNIFKSYNYENKSKDSPNLISMGIKDEKIKYFIRGIMDGDGCINFSNNNPQIYFASTYEQDWTYLENIVNQLKVKYSIRRIINGKNKHSILYIGGRKNSLLFLDWLYLNYNNDQIGLKRKYNKYIEIKKSLESLENYINSLNSLISSK
jgi:hypothetical protein